ncbi:retention module-containing protein [Shewanella sp. FJAT-52076]|uniref:retention module-containing protein n=1 Tax=Shewanella sp. FJAT-52076 TaxID=2864202 RepID=UPI001C65DE20|nr:retention module-containing protein [Shewanella sp. FJAT-52076]QYJ75009.1 retention module-containing protein [Shewanella sp. FJAT-52076]
MGSYITPKNGLLKSVNGQISMVAEGAEKSVSAGDAIPAGAVLWIKEGAQFELVLEDGTIISESNTPTTANQPEVGAEQLDPNALNEIEALQAQIAAGDDPTANLPETAAGGQTGNEGGSGFVSLDRTGSETLASTGFDSAFEAQATESQILDAQPIEPLDLTPPVITVDAPDNSTDTTPTITGTTDAEPGSTVTIVVTDSNGDTQTLTATVNEDGTYSVDVVEPLPEGGYTADASVSDTAGNTGTATDLGDVVSPEVSISANQTDVEEGNTASFVVSLDQASNEDITVTFTYSGVAEDGTDYIGVASVVIPAGQTSATININTIDDKLYEVSEDFTITISSVTGGNAVIGAANSASTNIVDEVVPGPEDTVTITLSGPESVIEGEVTSTYTVTLSDPAPAGSIVTLSYTYVTASGEDIVETVQAVIGEDGVTATFTIATIDDVYAEGDESFIVSVDSLTTADGVPVFEQLDLTGANVETTIKDAASPTDPEIPGEEDTVTVTLTGPATVTEGEVTATYTVTLSDPAPEGSIVVLTYTYTTASGDDIVETVQAVIGADGTTATFTIATVDDVYAEGDENFTVSVSEILTPGGNPVFELLDLTGANVETTIKDAASPTDPEIPGEEDTVTVTLTGPATVTEGEVTATYTVTLSDPAPEGSIVVLTYSYTTASGDDIVETVQAVIGADGTTATFTIATVDDVYAEGDENFTVSVSEILTPGGNPVFELLDLTGANVETTIKDAASPTDPEIPGEEDTVTVTLTGPATVTEGEVTATYTVTLSDPAPEGSIVVLTYSYTTASGDDIVETVQAVIGADGTTATFTIATVDDVYAEGDENFTVSVSEILTPGGNPVFELLDLTGANVETTIKDAASPTDPEIPGEEDTVTVTLTGPATVTEGEVTATYTVTLSDPAPEGSIVVLTYSYTTASGDDIVETVQAVIGADGTTATFTIATVDDVYAEGDENFTVSVSEILTPGGNPVFELLDLTGANVETTIKDAASPTDPEIPGEEDTVFVTLSGPATVAEGNTTSTYTVSLSDPAPEGSVVLLSYTYISASGDDIVETVQALVGADGVTATFTIDTVTDQPFEGAETFNVSVIGIVTTEGNPVFELLDLSGANVNTTIIDTNAPPTTDDLVAEGAEDDESIAIPALSGNDVDGTVVSFTINSLPTNGTLLFNGVAVVIGQSIATANAAGLTFEPDANWNGETTFTYSAVDNVGLVDPTPATVTISVASVNDAPVAKDNSYTATEDTLLTGKNIITDNDSTDGVDSDVDSTDLTIATVNGVDFSADSTDPDHLGSDGWMMVELTNGTLFIKADGTTDYLPNENSNATDTFTYTIQDDTGLESNTATVTIGVDAVNDAPVAKDNSYTATEDTLLTGKNIITDNDSTDGVDSDVDSTDLTIATVNGVDFSADSTDPDHLGSDGWMMVELTNGTLFIKADGTTDYLPNENSNATDTFTYTIQDDTGLESNTATVTIGVDAVNDAPVAKDNSYTATEDTLLTGKNIITDNDSTDGVDSDVDSTDLTIATVNGVDFSADSTDPDHLGSDGWMMVELTNGTLFIKADGTTDYLPNENSNATDTFTYTIQDDTGLESNTATVTIGVDAVNDAPVAKDNSYTATEDTLLTGKNIITDNDSTDGVDSDVDSTDLTIATVNGVDFSADSTDPDHLGSDGWMMVELTNGTLFIKADGTTDYLPNENSNATDTFTYTIQDDTGLESNTATVTIGVDAVNDAPVAKDNSYTATEDTLLTGKNIITDNDSTDGVDSDVDSTDLTIATVNGVDFSADSTDPDHLGSDGWMMVELTNGTLFIKADGTTDYLPNENSNATDTFTYTIQDDTGLESNTATVTIGVDAVNDAPVAKDNSYTATEDTLLTGKNIITDNDSTDGVDSDVDSTDLTIATVNGVDFSADSTDPDHLGSDGWMMVELTNGTLFIKADGTTDYLPNENSNATDTFTYTIQDDTGLESNTATVTIGVDAVNDAPVAKDNSYTATEDTLLTGKNIITDNDSTDGVDSDVDSTDLTIATVNGVDFSADSTDPDHLGSDGWMMVELTNGTLFIKADGTTDYLPNENSNATDTFTYTIQDDTGLESNTATVTIGVDAVNDAPVAKDNSYTATEDTLLTGKNIITDNDSTDGVDSDVDSTDLTIATVNGVDFSADSTDPDHLGSDGWMMVELTNGTLFIKADGTTDYLPNENSNATDTFTYTIQDDTGLESNTATVTIGVDAVNDAPVAKDNSYTATEDTLLTGKNIITDNDSTDGVDSDVDSTDLTIATVNGVDFSADSTDPDHLGSDGWMMVELTNGTLFIKADGTTDYLPNENSNATDTFTYTIQDDTGLESNTATVTIGVDAVNDAPVAKDNSYTATEDTLLTGKNIITDNDSTDGVDSDVDSTDLTIATVNGVDFSADSTDPDHLGSDGWMMVELTNGTLFIKADGTTDYLPNENSNATDTFTYTIQDDTGLESNTATVTIGVDAVNDAPVAKDNSYTATEDTLLTGKNIITDNDSTDGVDSDVDSTDLTIATVNGVDFSADSTDPDHLGSDGWMMVELTNGTLFIKADGTTDYLPNENSNATDTFTYTIQDDTGLESNTATVTIGVDAVNDAPVAKDNSYTATEDTLLTGKNIITDNDSTDGVDSDVDSTDLTIATVNGVDFSADSTDPDHLGSDGWMMVELTNGTLFIKADGTTDYLPNENSNATDTFTYTIQDDTGLESNTATVTIGVDAVNDAPVAKDNSYTATEDTLLTGKNIITDNDSTDGVDSDVDSTDLTIATVNGVDFSADSTDPDHLGSDGWMMVELTNGTLFIKADGTTDYLPNENSNATDTFTYTIQDDTGLESNTATVTIGVDAVNDAPVAKDNSYTATEDTLLTGKNIITDNDSTDGVDSDVDSTDLTIATVNGVDFSADSTDPDHLGSDGWMMVELTNGTLFIKADGTTDYLPNENSNATDTFTYTIQDDTGLESNTATVTIGVDAVNDAPVAKDNSYTATEDTLLTGKNIITDNDSTDGVDSDVDSTDLTIATVNGVDFSADSTDPDHLGSDGWMMVELTNGTLFIKADGTTDYLPNENSNATDTFTYTIQDDTGLESNTATVTIGVDAVNDAPVAKDNSYTATEDTLLTGKNIITDNDSTDGVDSDVDSTDLTIATVNGVDFSADSTDPDHLGSDGWMMVELTNGTLFIKADGTTDYLPNENSNATDTFTYTIQDDTGLESNTATVTIGVDAVNDAPVAKDNSYTATEDTLLTGKNIITDNDSTDGVDSDVDSTDLTIATVNGVDFSADSTDPDHLGSDGWMMVELTNGTLFIKADGTTDYLPNENSNATDTFTYTIQDDTGLESNTATVTIGVDAVNDAPVAKDNSYTATEDTLLTGKNIITDNDSTDGVDSDVDSTDLTIATVNGVDFSADSTDPDHLGSDGWMMVELTNGTLFIKADGTTDYLPNENSNATDTFTYTIQDDTGLESNTATVTIGVDAVNDAPVAKDNSYTATEDTLLTGKNIITDNDSTDGVDSDVDSTDLTIATVNGVDFSADSTDPDHLGSDGWMMVELTNGTLFIKADGTTDYLPNENSNATDTFTYTIQDDTGLESNTATVTIGVESVDDEVNIIGLNGIDETVYEANLASGTDPNADALEQSGTFSFISGDGLATVSIGDVSVDGINSGLGAILDLDALLALSDANPVTISTDYGTLTLTGFTGDASGGEISYTYTLDNTVDNDDEDAVAAGATAADFIDSIAVVVTDEDNNVNDDASATLDIRIVDDTVIADIADSSGENAAGTVITGAFTDPVEGADTAYSVDLSVNIADWDAEDSSTWFTESGKFTGDNEPIYYFVDPENPDTLIAYTDSGVEPAAWAGLDGNDEEMSPTQTLMFTLTVDPNGNNGMGSYVMNVVNPITTETNLPVNFTTNIGGNNYTLYVDDSGAITKTVPTSTAFTLTATTNGLADTVNSSNNGYGVGSSGGKDIGFTELLTLTFTTPISAVETLHFTYNSGADYTGDVTMILHGVDGNNAPVTVQLTGSSDELPALIEAAGLTSISSIDLTRAPDGEEFNLYGLTTSTLEVDPTGTDLEFNAKIIDSDGDFDSTNPFTVTLSAPDGLSAVTPIAVAKLSESTLLSTEPNSDSSLMVFKAGDSNINSFSFDTDVNDIHVAGIRQPMDWRIEGGVLIGSMPGRGDLLKLTLDWNAIEAGEQGSIVVEAELLGRLPHNVDYDSLSVTGIKVVATDTSGQTAKADVTVSVADSQHIAVDDSNQVNVQIDSFEVREITAAWTGWTAESTSSDVQTSDGDDDDSAHDIIRWGDVNGDDPRSGYNFDENTSIQVGDVGLNQNIVLGTFTHVNNPIYGDSAITKATLEVTLMINGVPAKVTLQFDHNETGGDNNPADIVTVANTSSEFVYDGARYTLKVMGFLDNQGNVVTSIETAEGRETSFPLVVQLIPGAGFDLPSVTGDVLFNDIQGADGNKEIFALSHGGSNASESNGTFVVQGTYGTLTLYSDGKYTYQVTTVGSLIPDNAVDKFSYTIEDNDGDLSTADLSISVNTVDAQPITPPQPEPDNNLYVGGQGVDSFLLNGWTPGKGLFAVSLGGHGSVPSQTINDEITLDTALHINAGDSNDYVDLGISKADNTVDTGSALPNVTDQLSQNDVLNSQFMTENRSKLLNAEGKLLQEVLSEVQPKTDTVNLGSGDDTVYGHEGTQMLYGGAGNDLLIGGEGIDGLRGGSGDDTLIGGLGDDVLRGDGGNDTFVWKAGETGTDHIIDFNLNKDKLDLSDLLQNEEQHSLEDYLSFSFENKSTVIEIDADRDGNIDQRIILDGVDLSKTFGTDTTGIINGLLGNGDGPLIVDTQGDSVNAQPVGNAMPLDDENKQVFP